MLLLSTYLICLLLLIDQSLFNLLLVSTSIHNRARTQTYIGFLTNDSISDEIDYNRYIQKEAT